MKITILQKSKLFFQRVTHSDCSVYTTRVRVEFSQKHRFKIFPKDKNASNKNWRDHILSDTFEKFLDRAVPARSVKTVAQSGPKPRRAFVGPCRPKPDPYI